jgi:glucose-1-phosphate thymidylyltransferase
VPTTQAVILARGLGTRMRRVEPAASSSGASDPVRGVPLHATPLSNEQRAAADAGAKGMMPIGGDAGRPFLEYVLSALADAGIREVVLVVAPDHAAIREHFTQAAPPQRTTLRFAVQDQPLGTADAVYAARDAVRAAPFLVVNADNYYTPAALRAAGALEADGLVAFEADALVRLSAIEPDRVLRYALLDIAPGDTLRAIREKPAPDDPLATAPERWVSMNLWSFTPTIFEACRRVVASPRGELELQDAVTVAMRDLGVTFRVARVHEGVLDLSRRADVAVVSAHLAGISVWP